MGSSKNVNDRKIQFVNLIPIDSESNIVKIEFAIDIKTMHLYQLIQTGFNESKTTFTITEFKSNQTLSNSLFSFDNKKYEKLQFSID